MTLSVGTKIALSYTDSFVQNDTAVKGSGFISIHSMCQLHISLNISVLSSTPFFDF